MLKWGKGNGMGIEGLEVQRKMNKISEECA